MKVEKATLSDNYLSFFDWREHVEEPAETVDLVLTRATHLIELQSTLSGRSTQAKIDEIDDANVTPGDYSVMVRGLPADVTKEEVCVARKVVVDVWQAIVRQVQHVWVRVHRRGAGAVPPFEVQPPSLSP